MALVQKEIKKVYLGSTQVRPSVTVIYDDFQGTTLDTSKWISSWNVSVNNALSIQTTWEIKTVATYTWAEKIITLEMSISSEIWIGELRPLFVNISFWHSLRGWQNRWDYGFDGLHWGDNPQNTSLSAPYTVKMVADITNTTWYLYINNTLWASWILTLPSTWTNLLDIQAVAGAGATRWAVIREITITIE